MSDEQTINKEDVVRLVVVMMTLASRDGELTASKEYIEKKVDRILSDPKMAWTILDPIRKSKLLAWLIKNDFPGPSELFDVPAITEIVGNPAHQALTKAIEEA
jgi:hypothetical protein